MFFDLIDDDRITTEELLSFIKMVYNSCETEEDLGYAEGYINMVLMDIDLSQVDEIIDAISMSEEMTRMRIKYNIPDGSMH
jgi:hypothetical protein